MKSAEPEGVRQDVSIITPPHELCFRSEAELRAQAVKEFVSSGAVWELIQQHGFNKLFPDLKAGHEFGKLRSLMRETRDPRYRRELVLGIDPDTDQVVFAPRRIFGGHAYILGKPGSGKTTGAGGCIRAQLADRAEDSDGVQHEHPPLVEMDCKEGGDPFSFALAQRIAEERKQELVVFTIDESHDSHLFDVAQLLRTEQDLAALVGKLSWALGLVQPEGFGPDFFNAADEAAIYEAIEKQRPQTIRELFRSVSRAVKKHRHDSALKFHLKRMLHCPNLIVDERPSVAAQKVLDFDALFEKRQVWYVQLDALSRQYNARWVARMLLLVLKDMCAARRKRGAEHFVLVAIDEFHTVATRLLVNLMSQSRSSGLCFILSHQSPSQLRLSDGEMLFGQVWDLTNFQQILTISDEQYLTPKLELASARTSETRRSGNEGKKEGFDERHTTSESRTSGMSITWSSAVTSSFDRCSFTTGGALTENFSRSHSEAHATGHSTEYSASKGWQEQMVCALTPELRARVNHTTLMSLVFVTGGGENCLTPTRGTWRLVQGLFPFPEEEFKKMRTASLPEREAMPPRTPDASREAITDRVTLPEEVTRPFFELAKRVSRHMLPKSPPPIE